MRSSPRSEAEVGFWEPRFINWREYLAYRLLYNSIYHRRDSQFSSFAFFFLGYFNPTDWVRLIFSVPYLFVRPEICLHLPSDSTSRWTPLVFSYDLPATGWSRDFHPLECAHDGCAAKKASPLGNALFLNILCCYISKIFPGFRILLGSRAFFIARIISSSSGLVNSSISCLRL